MPEDIVEQAEVPIPKNEEEAANGQASSKLSGVYVTTGVGESENPPEPTEANEKDPSGPIEHRFWNTQPVPQSKEDLAGTPQEIKPVQKIVPKKVSNEFVPLPDTFYYCVIDVNCNNALNELKNFLRDNYVEDDEGKFRFAYSANQIKWWLTTPGHDMQLYSIGIRNKSDDELVGYINGVPGDYTIQGKTARFLVVDFLCLKSSLRSRGLAPILIQELTRRAYKNGIYSAVYTSGTKLTEPVAKPLYHHRMINTRKLLAIGFAKKPKFIPEKTYNDYYELPKIAQKTLKETFRQITQNDYPLCMSMANKFAERNFSIRNCWSKKVFAHLNDNRPGVVSTYVMTNGKTGSEEKILGWMSWYLVMSSVLEESAPNNIMTTAYVYYYAYEEKLPSFEYDPKNTEELTAEQKQEIAECEAENSKTLEALFTRSLHEMKRGGVDVCTCLDIMKNPVIIEKTRFEKGDAYLNYYLFNMKWTKDIDVKDIAIVLI